MLKDNLRKAFAGSGLCVREIAEKSGVRKRTIDEWVGGRGKMPGAEALYKVCKTLEITVEEALEGEKGRGSMSGTWPPARAASGNRRNGLPASCKTFWAWTKSH
ncbi:MAG: helix-turn-helix transcriptional regulator [Treponematales bacterium]